MSVQSRAVGELGEVEGGQESDKKEVALAIWSLHKTCHISFSTFLYSSKIIPCTFFHCMCIFDGTNMLVLEKYACTFVCTTRKSVLEIWDLKEQNLLLILHNR